MFPAHNCGFGIVLEELGTRLATHEAYSLVCTSDRKSEFLESHMFIHIVRPRGPSHSCPTQFANVG